MRQISWQEFDALVQHYSRGRSSLGAPEYAIAVHYHLRGEILDFSCHGFQVDNWESLVQLVSHRAIIDASTLHYENNSANMSTTYNSIFLMYIFSEENPPDQRVDFPLTDTKLVKYLPYKVRQEMEKLTSLIDIMRYNQEIMLPFMRTFVRTRLATKYEGAWVFRTEWKNYRPGYTIEKEKSHSLRIYDWSVFVDERSINKIIVDGKIIIEGETKHIIDRIIRHNVYAEYHLYIYNIPRLSIVMSKEEFLEKKREYRKHYPRHIAKRKVLADREQRLQMSDDMRPYLLAEQEWKKRKKAFIERYSS